MFSLSDGRPAPADPSAVVTGHHVRFTVLTSRLLRLEHSPTGEFVDERTQAVVDRAFEVPPFTVTRSGEGADERLEIVTEHLHLHYAGGPFTSSSLSVTLLKDASDAHYSAWRFGQTYPQDLPHRGNLLGTARTLDEVDGATELEQGILATYGFAVLDDSSSVLLDADGWVAPRPASPAQADHASHDLYLFAHGRDFAAALRDYHHLTGPTPLIPRYTLGNWWSRYWPYTETTYLELMDRFRDEAIPLSVAVIDMDWHLTDVDPEIGTGWTGYTWNRDLFPEPSRFLDALHERGLAVTLNTHPADGVRRHEDAYPAMAQALGIDPASGVGVAFDVASREFVDAYLRLLHHPLEEEGVDFWWLDWQSGGTTAIPGLDPLWMLNHIHFTDSARQGRRPLTFSRYAGLGSHRYPVGFSGDTIITWASLDFQPYFTATAANVGYTWWSHDVGGHMFGARDVELATRWVQLGVFSPINRLHSSASAFTSKEPWTFGPRAEAIMGRYLRLRHALIPVLYTAAWAAHTDAIAVVRPMYHDHPRTPEAFRVPNQAMIGEHLLLAPITTPEEPTSHLASVDAWLPEGSWTDLVTGARYDGGRTVRLHRPLERYPVLARGGAVLPLAADPLADAAARPDTLALRVIPGTGVSRLVEDDGSAAPEAEVTEIRQTLSTDDDGGARLELTLTRVGGPATGAGPRGVLVDLAGVASVGGVELEVDGEVRAVVQDPVGGEAVAGPVAGELLAPALRLDLGRLDLDAGFVLTVTGARAIERDVVADAFGLLEAAEIAFVDKERAWHAVRTLEGLALVQELATVPLPVPLRDALVEVAAARSAW
ncbi:glycoside hydrolase [Serinibacter arcticus]|uniref:Glycoside hydrolase n=1 Tax=Serinibacter arcticus TaxID=1655435 RepID=A0A2U1ZW44_9MICO|nr:glycoside hydrolase family 31 protein [Serinibacter arcticus]PWD51160.1 glycoside hydrolase [Serinibacter arcticus]